MRFNSRIFKETKEAIFIKTHIDAQIPQFHGDSIGCDITLIEDYVIPAQQSQIIRSGLIAIPPKGFHWKAYLRSSVGKNYKGLILANHVGIIDPDYIGPEDELKFILQNINQNHDYKFLQKGQRIIQLILERNYRPIRIREFSLEDYKHGQTSRSGFGSTGK